MMRPFRMPSRGPAATSASPQATASEPTSNRKETQMLQLTKTALATGFAAIALAGAPTPALADDPIERSAAAEQAAFQADRETILAMAGDYKVTFDMQESTP